MALLSRLANQQLVDVRNQLQDAGKTDDVYSEIKTPPISDCPAYGPVQTTGTRVRQEMGEQNTEYEF